MPVSIEFLVVAAGFILFLFGLRWAKRFSFVPGPDHDPSDHHHLGPVAAVIGILAICGLMAMGYGEVAADEIIEVVEEIVE